MAEVTAKCLQPDNNIVKKAKHAEIMGSMIAKRIAIIQATIGEGSDPNETIYELDPLPCKEQIDQAARNSSWIQRAVEKGHRLTRQREGHKCDNCGTYRSVQRFSFWLTNKCKPQPFAHNVLKRKLAHSRQQAMQVAIAIRRQSEEMPSQSMCIDQAYSQNPEVSPTTEHTTQEEEDHVPTHDSEQSELSRVSPSVGKRKQNDCQDPLDQQNTTNKLAKAESNHTEIVHVDPGSSQTSTSSNTPHSNKRKQEDQQKHTQDQTHKLAKANSAAKGDPAEGNPTCNTTHLQSKSSNLNTTHTATSEEEGSSLGFALCHRASVHFDEEDYGWQSEEQWEEEDGAAGFYDDETFGEITFGFEDEFVGSAVEQNSTCNNNSDDHSTQEENHRGSNNKPAMVTRKRLRCKTARAKTPYTNITPLACRKEYKDRREQIRKILAHNREQQQIAERKARRNLQINTSKVYSLIDEQGMGEDLRYNFSNTDKIHTSHHLKGVKANNKASYCERCGAWSTGGPIKALGKPCTGQVTKGRQFQHRLLCLGVLPTVGSRIPSHGRKRKCHHH